MLIHRTKNDPKFLAMVRKNIRLYFGRENKLLYTKLEKHGDLGESGGCTDAAAIPDIRTKVIPRAHTSRFKSSCICLHKLLSRGCGHRALGDTTKLPNTAESRGSPGEPSLWSWLPFLSLHTGIHHSWPGNRDPSPPP